MDPGRVGGGGGHDIADFSFAFDAIALFSNAPGDWVDPRDSGPSDALFGIEEIIGSSSRDGDSIRGGAGDDIIRGGGGPDLLQADQGNNQLFGGRGADTLRLGLGREDVAFGGAGEDTFLILSDTRPGTFGGTRDAPPHDVIIRDFDSEKDSIDLLGFGLSESEMFDIVLAGTETGQFVTFQLDEATSFRINGSREDFIDLISADPDFFF